MKHYLVLSRTPGHCTVWLLRAYSLKEAMLKYVVEELGYERHDNLLINDDGFGNIITYSHPLECIEADEKTGEGWDIVEIKDQQWESDFINVLCSQSSSDVKDYAEIALPFLREEYPHLDVRAFAWTVLEGFLVTFYKSDYVPGGKIEVVERYYLTGHPWPTVSKWKGTYEELTSVLAVDW